MVLGRQKQRHIDFQLFLPTIDLFHQNSSVHEIQLMPVHFLWVYIVIGYFVLDLMHRYIIKIVLEAFRAVLPRSVAVEQQQLVKLLSIGTPDHLKIFTEVLLELHEDFSAPAVLFLLEEGIKQVIEQVVDVFYSRGSHAVGRMRDGMHDDSVALFEHEVDVLDCLE